MMCLGISVLLSTLFITFSKFLSGGWVHIKCEGRSMSFWKLCKDSLRCIH